jgi:predicted metal-dependent HD superfamily phosphohydrolase
MPRRASLERFKKLWSRCGSEHPNDASVGNVAESGSAHVTARAEEAAGLGADLLARYAESGRLYHTIDHIDHCLGQFDDVRDDCIQADAVELAIWFHDAIYNFPAYENEKLSAGFFMEKSEQVLDNRFRKDVAALVIATEHLRVPNDPDQRILVDVDLSSFGLPWEKFAADGRNIRKELHYLTDAEFYKGQIAFMQSLLGRDRIFNTTHFYNAYESIARDNVGRYLGSLRDRGFMDVDDSEASSVR